MNLESREKTRRATKREWFFQMMNDMIPWGEWVDYIYTQCSSQWLSYPSGLMETLLRLYLLQTWYNLDEKVLLDNVYDSQAMRAFIGEPFEELPDMSELSQFRVMLESEQVSEKLFNSINRSLRGGGAALRGGSIVEAGIIRVPRKMPRHAGKVLWPE